LQTGSNPKSTKFVIVRIQSNPRPVQTKNPSGTAARQWEAKELRAMKPLKTAINIAFFCSATILTSKILREIIENYSEDSGCANSYHKYVSS